MVKKMTSREKTGLAILFEQAARVLPEKWNKHLVQTKFEIRRTTSPRQMTACLGCPAPWADYFFKQQGDVWRWCCRCVEKLWKTKNLLFFCYPAEGVVVVLEKPPLNLGNKFNQHPPIYQFRWSDVEDLKKDIQRGLEKCSP